MGDTGTEVLTSANNPLVRQVRRAVSKGGLTAGGCVVAESLHLLEEALRSGCRIRAVLAAESARPRISGHVKRLKGVRVVPIEDQVFVTISATEASQGVIALVELPAWTLDRLFNGSTMVVVLDGVQDPGNAGAIVRAAEAFGATGALFVKGSVSPYNPKTLRASAGSLFRLPFVAAVDPAQARTTLEHRELDVWAAHPRGRTSLSGANLTRRFALVIGSEGHGVSDQLAGCARDLRIPTAGVESLNAALAAGIILHEASRQRAVSQ